MPRFWRLDSRYAYRTYKSGQHLLVYHGGSAATHCLTGDSALVFELFLQNPEMIADEATISSKLTLQTDDVSTLLDKLKRLYLIIQLEGKVG